MSFVGYLDSFPPPPPPSPNDPIRHERDRFGLPVIPMLLAESVEEIEARFAMIESLATDLFKTAARHQSLPGARRLFAQVMGMDDTAVREASGLVQSIPRPQLDANKPDFAPTTDKGIYRPVGARNDGQNQCTFGLWQAAYSEQGIATFPVSITNEQKKPAIKGWQDVDLARSAELALKFPNSDAFGFCLGMQSGITVLDVDTNDERVFLEALEQFGKTPIIVRSAKGNYQAWYRHNGESRRIRPFEARAIDVLGAGFVVAPPSRGITSRYQFIAGGLDDLGSLPVMIGLDIAKQPQLAVGGVAEGQRNESLFRLCMKAAHHCDDFDGLLDVARTRNAEFLPPLLDDEVIKVATSAWGYTERGKNRFGTPGAFFPADEASHLIATDQDGLVLLAFLRANNRPGRTFMVSNGLADQLQWPRKRLAATRTRLTGRYIRQVRRASQGRPALYCWTAQPGQN